MVTCGLVCYPALAEPWSGSNWFREASRGKKRKDSVVPKSCATQGSTRLGLSPAGLRALGPGLLLSWWEERTKPHGTGSHGETKCLIEWSTVAHEEQGNQKRERSGERGTVGKMSC